MLDECKGERLEEVLAVFSNAVLKKILLESGQPETIAQQLALENFSYSGERTILSNLILAHKASLRGHLLDKNELRAQYKDFSDLLNLNDRRIARRHEQLKQVIEERGPRDEISEDEIRRIQDRVRKNWSGNNEWLETIVHGDIISSRNGLLGTQFDTVWRHVERGRIGDIESKTHAGLLEQLNVRVKDQEARLARWQDFGKTLSRSTSPAKSKDFAIPQEKRIDLGFTQHQSLQIGRASAEKMGAGNSTVALEEYTRLINNMRVELADVEKAKTPKNRLPRLSIVSQRRKSSTVSSLVPQQSNPPPSKDEGWSSASDSEDSPGSIPVPRSVSLPGGLSDKRFRNDPKEHTLGLVQEVRKEARNIDKHEVGRMDEGTSTPPQIRSPTQIPPLPSESQALTEPPESESALADQILNSVSASSPSPKKTRHTLSLAERTRLSMSRVSHSQYSDLHDDVDNIADLPRLSIRPKQTQPPKRPPIEAEEQKHADLIERTRKSMAGFEAAQKKAQIERRRSVKDAKKKQRESSYFPKVEEEPLTPNIDPVELIEGDPDYDSVFKSRPKIKTSPAVSPTRIWEDESED